MRLFVAVWPSEDVVEALRRLPRPGVKGVRWTAPPQWHVTVRFLGEVDDAEADATAAAYKAIAAALPARPVTAGPATACFGRSVLMVPVAGLDDLLAAAGNAEGDGHLTLARSRQYNLRRLAGEAFDATWDVDELTLVRSRLTPDGAVYEVIGRWDLTAQ